MIGLIVSGCVVLVLGPTVAANKQCPTPFGSPSSTGKTYTDPSGLVLSWLGLVALAALGMLVWQNLAPHVLWVKRAATWGVVAAIATFPVFAAFLGATGCGL